MYNVAFHTYKHKLAINCICYNVVVKDKMEKSLSDQIIGHLFHSLQKFLMGYGLYHQFNLLRVYVIIICRCYCILKSVPQIAQIKNEENTETNAIVSFLRTSSIMI